MYVCLSRHRLSVCLQWTTGPMELTFSVQLFILGKGTSILSREIIHRKYLYTQKIVILIIVVMSRFQTIFKKILINLRKIKEMKSMSTSPFSLLIRFSVIYYLDILRLRIEQITEINCFFIVPYLYPWYNLALSIKAIFRTTTHTYTHTHTLSHTHSHTHTH